MKPDVLAKKNDAGEEVFRITAVENGKGGLSKYGIAFDGSTRNGNRASVTLPLPTCCDGENIKEVIVEKFYDIMMNLVAVEDAALAVIPGVSAAKASLGGMIDVID